MEHKQETAVGPTATSLLTATKVTMDIVPILPGQTHPSILHILSEGSVQLLCGGRCHPTDSSDMCGSIIVVIQYIIFTIGVTARLMGDQDRYGVSKPAEV